MTPRGGIILRLIDVVLNLLFGIMCMSEVKRIADVELPKTREVPQHPLSASIMVGLREDGSLRTDEDRPLARDSLQAFIRRRRGSMVAEDAGEALVDIYADRRAYYKDVQWVRQVCRAESLAQRVTVVTDYVMPSSPGGSP